MTVPAFPARISVAEVGLEVVLSEHKHSYELEDRHLS